MLDHPYVLALCATVLGLTLGWSLEKLRRPAAAGPHRKRGPKPRPDASPAPRSDAADQLRTVMGADYVCRPILSARETRVFEAALSTISSLNLGWRVMAQVSMGEILASRDPAAHAAINSKRVDILLVDAKGWPKAAIEYQGSGHYQGTAAARDAVKKEALRRAGVAYIEIQEGQKAADLRAAIARIAAVTEVTAPPQAAIRDAPSGFLPAPGQAEPVAVG